MLRASPREGQEGFPSSGIDQPAQQAPRLTSSLLDQPVDIWTQCATNCRLRRYCGHTSVYGLVLRVLQS